MSRSFSFFTLALIFLLIGLGTWQLQRKKEKESLLYALAENQKKPPQNVDDLSIIEPFISLYATGHFIKGKTIYIHSKVYEGKNGFYVVDLFKTEKGKYILVQRGWSEKQSSTLPSGTLTVEGVGRFPSKPNFFQPDNTPPNYFWIDLKGLSQTFEIPLLSYYMVATSMFSPEIFPTKPIPSLSNNHLQYSITWYFLAFMIGCMLLWLNTYYKKEGKQ